MYRSLLLLYLLVLDMVVFSRKPEPPTKAWTVMVYMAADNDLDYNADLDLKEMVRANYPDSINVIVQVDRQSWETGRLLQMKRALDYNKEFMDIGEINSGDPHSLTTFIRGTMEKYPATHYGLIIWSHGSGWQLRQMQLMAYDGETPAYKAVAFDKTGDRLYTHEIGIALQNAGLTDKKLDFIGFDACFMNMLEVWYEVKDYARFGIASEHLEPSAGWDYTALIKSISQKGEPSEVCKAVVQDYKNYNEKRNSDEPYTLSAVNLEQVGPLAAQLSAMQPLLTKEKAAVKVSRSKQTPYDFKAEESWPNGIDLKHFILLLRKNTKNEELKGKLNEFIRQFDKTVIANVYSAKERELNGSYGVAIYFPEDKSTYLKDPDHNSYAKNSTTQYPVAFVNNEKWVDFLMAYYGIKEKKPTPEKQ